MWKLILLLLKSVQLLQFKGNVRQKQGYKQCMVGKTTNMMKIYVLLHIQRKINTWITDNWLLFLLWGKVLIKKLYKKRLRWSFQKKKVRLLIREFVVKMSKSIVPHKILWKVRIKSLLLMKSSIIKFARYLDKLRLLMSFHQGPIGLQIHRLGIGLELIILAQVQRYLMETW